MYIYFVYMNILQDSLYFASRRERVEDNEYELVDNLYVYVQVGRKLQQQKMGYSFF